METIALIVADDTGEGILETPEEPDDRFDDMTLISQFFPLFFAIFADSAQSVLLLSLRIGPISSTPTSDQSDSAGICITATGRK